MNEKIDGFWKELRTKLDGVDKRLHDLKGGAKGATEKGKAEAKAQLAALESRAKEQHAKVQSVEAKTKAWLEEKKTATSEKIAAWKAQHDVKNSPLMPTALGNTQWRPCASLRPRSTKPNGRRLKRW